ncbi:diaminopimelate epimerase [Enterococcus sp. ZJ1622]|uniref:diaminopimelate epimerase n=1 Tax=Enterococcus sp. ZJ1622 TaxID=2709401 RepID=UPI0013EB614A|nr:diaminopimelate epimerase [Enterococcus sp. ZJ1622]
MNIHKYNGCGNDFLLLDHIEHTDYSELARRLCAKESFDTDGLIAVKTDPLEMVYFNKDGSRAPMCGNGIRCFARYVRDQKLIEAQEFMIETLAGARQIHILDQDPFYCEVEMGRPDYSPEKLAVDQLYPIRNQMLQLGDETRKVTSLFMGTIHTVVFVENADAELSKKTGERICHHPLFKERTNVNFVEVVNEHELIVRTYERGVGWTLACGTDCCAAYVAAKENGYISEQEVTVHLAKGDLVISGEESIRMAGPAIHEWTKPMEG